MLLKLNYSFMTYVVYEYVVYNVHNLLILVRTSTEMSLHSVSRECSCDLERQSGCDTISATSLLAKIPQTLLPPPSHIGYHNSPQHCCYFTVRRTNFGNDNDHNDADVNRKSTSRLGVAARVCR